MFEANLDPSERLLTVRYSGQVNSAEIDSCLLRITDLLACTTPGFQVLTDLSGLELMDHSCASGLGSVLDLLSARKVGRIATVVPDPQKDIGFDLISQFHGGSDLKRATFETVGEAMENLAN